MEEANGKLQNVARKVLQRFAPHFLKIRPVCISQFVVTRKKKKSPIAVPEFFFKIHSSGLGTSTSKEAKEYFAEMERHRITFKYGGAEDDAAITLVSVSQDVQGCWLSVVMLGADH